MSLLAAVGESAVSRAVLGGVEGVGRGVGTGVGNLISTRVWLAFLVVLILLVLYYWYYGGTPAKGAKEKLHPKVAKQADEEDELSDEENEPDD